MPSAFRATERQVARECGAARSRRARSADALSPLRHRENLLLQPRRKSEDKFSYTREDNYLVTVVRPGMVVDPEDPGRLLNSAGSMRSLPAGTRSLDAKLLARLEEHRAMAEQEEIGSGNASAKKPNRLEEHVRGNSAPAGWQRPSTPLAWGTVELGANRLRQEHAATVATRNVVVTRPQSAIEVAESALDGTYRHPKPEHYCTTNAPSESTAAPAEREVEKRVHELYHSAKGAFDEVDSDDNEEWMAAYNGTWISHTYIPTKRGNQRRAGVTEATLGPGATAAMSMAEMMAAAVKAQQEEEDLERRTGMTKDQRRVVAKRQRRLQRERDHAQRLWRKKRLDENLGEGMSGEWRPGIEREGTDVPVRKPLRAARLAARDRRRAKQTSLAKRLSAQVGKVVARAISR